MAEEVVVKEQLTQEMKDAGYDLTNRLRHDRDFDLRCALWLYSSDTNRWRLVIATPIVDSTGPIHAYKTMEGIVGEDWPYPDAPMYEVSILRSNHSLVLALQSFGHFEIQELPSGSRPSPAVRNPKKVKLSRVEGVFIEEAVIYYIK